MTLEELKLSSIKRESTLVEFCECEFDSYPEDDEDFGEESWHYLRTCLICGETWWALHCPHDGIQNPCPCGEYPTPLEVKNE